MSAIITLRKSVKGTRLSFKGTGEEVKRMLFDAIVCHPTFREFVVAALSDALEYLESGKPCELIEVKEKPDQSSEN